jgi:hypothetical protein
VLFRCLHFLLFIPPSLVLLFSGCLASALTRINLRLNHEPHDRPRKDTNTQSFVTFALFVVVACRISQIRRTSQFI